MQPTRTGRIIHPVSLTDPKYGPYEIPAGAPVYAATNGVAMAGRGGSIENLASWIVWCAFGALGRTSVCVERRGKELASYQEQRAGGQVTRAALTPSRFWTGPTPVIEETPLAPDQRVISQLRIASMTDRGITLRKDTVDGDYISRGPETKLIAFGSGVRDPEPLGGYAFTVNAGAAPDNVRIVFVSQPH